jgi:phospholipid transport system substrate-binding protein
MKKFIGVVFCVVCLCISASPAFSDDASDVYAMIKNSMDQGLAIAKETGKSDDQKRKELWDIVRTIFDFKQITEFALGQFSYNAGSNLGEYADRRFSKAQQDEFQDLFTTHLGNNYLDRIDFNNVDVTIDLKPAVMLATKRGIKRAMVPSIVNGKTPIDYMVLDSGEGWKIYDVKVEGRSLVAAFRTEYKNILLNNKPDVLIKMLKDKIAEHEAAKNKTP